MALSFALNNAGFTATAIDSEARLTMDTVDGKPTITAVHLTTRAQVPNISAAQFAEIASSAKAGCVVSRALAPSITITMDASLAS
jgi:osmotically inducible protein OsmC